MLLRMLAYAVHRKIANNPKASISGLEEERPRRVLISPVPAANDKNESWRDCTFEEALQSTEYHQMGPVLGSANASNADTPAEHVDAETFPQRPALEEEIGGKLSTHVCQVEDCREPGVLLSNELRVVAKTEDGLNPE